MAFCSDTEPAMQMSNTWDKYCTTNKLGFTISHSLEKIHPHATTKLINMVGFKIKLLDLNLTGTKCGLD